MTPKPPITDPASTAESPPAGSASTVSPLPSIETPEVWIVQVNGAGRIVAAAGRWCIDRDSATAAPAGGRPYLEALTALGHPAPEDAERVGRGLGEVLSGRCAEWSTRCAVRRPDGVGAVVVRILAAAVGGERGAFITHADPSEAQSAHDALVESERRFRQLTESIDEAFWLTDWTDRRVLYVSPGYERIWGRSCESLYRNARSWSYSVHPDDRERVIRSFEQDAERGVFDEQYRILLADGSERWIRDRAFPIRDEEGRVIRMAGLSEDVTGQRELEEELRQLNLAVENAMTGVSRVGPDGCFRLVNESYAHLLGYEPSEMAGMPWQRTVHPDDQEILRSCAERMQRSGRGEAEARAVRRDGSTFTKQVLLVRVLGPRGEPDGHYCFMRDSTEHRQAADQLHLQAQLLASVRESIIATDLDGRVIYWGGGAERLYGYRAEEVLGQSIEFIVKPHDRDAERQRMNQVLDTGSWQGEYEQLRRDGTSFWAETAISLVRDANGEPAAFVGIDRDVSERKLLEEAVRNVAEGVSAETGEAFFRRLVSHLAEALGCAYVLVGRLETPEATVVRSAAVFGHGRLLNNIEYELAGTPCANVTQRRLCVYASGVQGQFPRDELLAELGAESYAGTALVDSAGRVVGLIVILDDKPLTRPALVASLLRIFASRAAAELERARTERELREQGDRERQLTRELDHRVRNNLTALVALVDMTRRSAPDVESFADAIRGRIHAMAQVHGLLSHSQWRALGLRELIEALTPPDCRDQVMVDAPDLAVAPEQAAAVGMVLHELFTNSLKYGALREPEGRICCRWTDRGADASGHRLLWTWQERGGPSIEQEPSPNLGAELVTGLVRSELAGTATLRFPESGANHEFEVLLEPPAPPFEPMPAEQATRRESG